MTLQNKSLISMVCAATIALAGCGGNNESIEGFYSGTLSDETETLALIDSNNTLWASYGYIKDSYGKVIIRNGDIVMVAFISKNA